MSKVDFGASSQTGARSAGLAPLQLSCPILKELKE